MFVAKWIAWSSTGSVAVFSDALETVVHLIAVAFALFSLLQTQKNACHKYPWGRDKIAFFSSGFEGLLVAVAGLASFVAAVQRFENPGTISRPELGILWTAAAALLTGIVGAWLVRLGKKSGSIILEANGKHVLADTLTSVGVIVGLALVHYTGWAVADPLVAIALSLHLLREGWTLLRESFYGLMDRSDEEKAFEVRMALLGIEDQLGGKVDSVRVRRGASREFVSFKLRFERNIDIRFASAAARRAETFLRAGIIDAKSEISCELGTAYSELTDRDMLRLMTPSSAEVRS